MSKIKRISVCNLKAISAFTADFNGCTAIITGANNKGKSSLLKSLPEWIRGNKPDVILKHGEKEGNAELELTTGEKFVLSFDSKKEKLTYISERNIHGSITKEVAKMYFPPVFDVDKFLNDAPAKQNKTLQQLSKLDFSEVDKAYSIAYEARTYANKRRDEEKVKHESNLPDPGINDKETESLEQELNGIEVHNLKHKQGIDRLVELGNAEKSLKEEILEIEKKLIVLKERLSNNDDAIKIGSAWLADTKNQPKTNKDQLQKKVDEIKRNNAAIELRASYIKAKEAAEQADLEVKKIEQDKKEMIRLAQLPEGFGFSDDGITYEGHAFNREQLSSSSIYIAALKLAALQLGEVRMLHFDASFLDKNSLAKIEEWANTNDLQLLIERPDFEGGEIKYELVNCE